MFTQCPECQTVFRLRLQQLKAAGGQVRCSRCHSVFDALDHMVTSPRSAGNEASPPSPPLQSDTTDGHDDAAAATVLEETLASEPAGMVDGLSQTAADDRHNAQHALPDGNETATQQPPESVDIDALIADNAADEPDTIETPVTEPDTAEADALDLDVAEESDSLDIDALIADSAVDEPDTIETPAAEPDTAEADALDLDVAEESDSLDIDALIADSTADEPDTTETPATEPDTTEIDALDLDVTEEPDSLDIDALIADNAADEPDTAETPVTEADTAEADALELDVAEEANSLDIDALIADSAADEPDTTKAPATEPETAEADALGLDVAEEADSLDIDTLIADNAADEPDTTEPDAAEADALDLDVTEEPDSLDIDALIADNAADEPDTIEAPAMALETSEIDELDLDVAEDPDSLDIDALIADNATDEPDTTEAPAAEPDTTEADALNLDVAEEPDSLDIDALIADNAADEPDTTEAPATALETSEIDELDLDVAEESDSLDIDALIADNAAEDIIDTEATTPVQDMPTDREWDAEEPFSGSELSGDEEVPLDEAPLTDDARLEEAGWETWQEVGVNDATPSTELADELDLVNPWEDDESTDLIAENEENNLPLSEEASPHEDEAATPEPAAPGAAWDTFSEQHIESLLTPAEGEEAALPIETASSEDYSLPEQESPLEPEISGKPEETVDEDEALLNQLLPDDDTELDQELDRLHTDARSEENSDLADDSIALAAGSAPPPNYHLEPNEAAAPSRGPLAGLLWGLGVITLIATLGLQFVYYHHSQLAHHTQLRPLLDQLCKLTECELPPQRELGQIRLASHLVQFHPRYQNSLLITATLINRAPFNQPYPEVELLMTNLQQEVVASRRFRPEEYLVGQRSDRPMPQNIEIPLMLEVVDPGKDVVGFRFEFH